MRENETHEQFEERYTQQFVKERLVFDQFFKNVMSACAGTDEKNWKYVFSYCFSYLSKMAERQDKFLRCVRIESKNTFSVIPNLLKDIDDINIEDWEKIAETPHLITKKFD